MDASYSSPIDLRSDRHHDLISQVSTASSRFAAPYIRFIYFHLAPQLVPARPHHCAPQLLQPQPRCPVTAKAQKAL
jgi:hypothetical protein